jgi:hypothetical protein
LQEYEAIFMNRLTIVVAYNVEIFSEVQSLKLNNYHTYRVYYRSLIELLTIARNQWFENGSLFRKTTSLDDQIKFLWNLSSFLKSIHTLKKDSVKDMKEIYKNYLHPIMLDAKL